MPVELLLGEGVQLASEADQGPPVVLQARREAEGGVGGVEPDRLQAVSVQQGPGELWLRVLCLVRVTVDVDGLTVEELVRSVDDRVGGPGHTEAGDEPVRVVDPGLAQQTQPVPGILLPHILQSDVTVGVLGQELGPRHALAHLTVLPVLLDRAELLSAGMDPEAEEPGLAGPAGQSHVRPGPRHHQTGRGGRDLDTLYTHLLHGQHAQHH